jgi:hypothetical protein
MKVKSLVDMATILLAQRLADGEITCVAEVVADCAAVLKASPAARGFGLMMMV